MSRCTSLNGSPGARTSIALIVVAVRFVAAFLGADFLLAACFVATGFSERVRDAFREKHVPAE
jgi:hypothetical protein